MLSIATSVLVSFRYFVLRLLKGCVRCPLPVDTAGKKWGTSQVAGYESPPNFAVQGPNYVPLCRCPCKMPQKLKYTMGTYMVYSHLFQWAARGVEIPSPKHLRAGLRPAGALRPPAAATPRPTAAAHRARTQRADLTWQSRATWLWVKNRYPK